MNGTPSRAASVFASHVVLPDPVLADDMAMRTCSAPRCASAIGRRYPAVLASKIADVRRRAAFYKRPGMSAVS